MRRFLFENGLTVFFLAILLLALAGQSVAGLAEFNGQQTAAGLETLSYGQYLLSSDFAVDVAENWQSEFLQFTLYIFATVWLVQRGSSESRSWTRSVGNPMRTSRSARMPNRIRPPGRKCAGGSWGCTRGRWGSPWPRSSWCRGWRSQSPVGRRSTGSSSASGRIR